MRCSILARLVALAFMSGCHKTPPATLTEAGVGGSEASSPDSGEPAPRCAAGARVDLGATDRDVDVGQALSVSSGAVVGVLRTSQGKRVASVARLSRSSGATTFVDLGSVSGSVSAPTLFARGDELFASSAVVPLESTEGLHGGGPCWTLFRVTQTAEALARLPETLDPELPAVSGLALASGSPFGAVIAWDESAPEVPGAPRADAADQAPRGIVRIAFLGPDLRTVARVESVSPSASNAERPQVVLREGGFWVAWIARQVEPAREIPGELERPGVDRAYRWVELVALDTSGKPVTPIRRLTPLLGHVASFELIGGARSRADVYVDLDDERTQGAGGSLAHVMAGVDTTPRLTPLIPEGRERETPSCLAQGSVLPSFALYVDLGDRIRALPLDADGQAEGASSSEPAFEGARVLVASHSLSPSTAIEVLASTGSRSTDSPENRSLQWFSCEPPHR
jgi:hypothetical protein